VLLSTLTFGAGLECLHASFESCDLAYFVSNHLAVLLHGLRLLRVLDLTLGLSYMRFHCAELACPDNACFQCLFARLYGLGLGCALCKLTGFDGAVAAF